MQYDLLVHNLQEYGGKACAYTGEPIRVQGAQLMGSQYIIEGHTYYNRDFLFVGYTSELPADPGEAPHDAVCIEDVPVPKSYISSSEINLILASADADLLQLYQSIVFNLADDTRILNHGLFFSELDSSALTPAGLMDLAYERLHNPVLLVSPSYRIIAHSRSGPSVSGVERQAIRAGRFSREQMQEAMENELYQLYEAKGVADFSDQFPPGRRWCVLPVMVHGFVIAYLMVTNSETILFNSDFFFISKLRDLLAEMMERDSGLYSDEGLMHAALFEDLIDGKHQRREELNERIRFLHWKQSDAMYLLWAEYHGSGGEDAAKALRERFPDCRYLVRGEELVWLLHLPEMEYGENMAALEQLLEQKNLKGALSGRFSDYEQMQGRYDQAKHVREVARQLNHERALLTYDRYAGFFLAEAACHSLDLKIFIPDGFRKLAAYDEQHHTGLADTLELYLYYGGMPREAVRELCISKSTAYYRLEKIRELSRLDLENGAVRLQVMVAVAAYKLYGKSIL